VVGEVLRESDRLMVDQYGNYFMQSLVQELGESHRLKLIESIKHFIQVAQNARGTHVLQNIVKAINSQSEEDAFINKVKTSGIHYLVKNQNSVHVLIQLINKAQASNLDFMLDYVEANFVSVCKDKHGICLVKAM